MGQFMRRVMSATLLATALIASMLVVPAPAKADDRPRRYYDRDRRDRHTWDDREDRAYRQWIVERRRAQRDFHRLKKHEQREYWRWRHEHRDIG